MGYETFIPKSFNPKHRAIIDRANSIMKRYASQGYDLSLRQLYYQFIAHYSDLFPGNGPGGSPNTEQNYKMLGNVISDARLAGELDWDTLVDRGRETVENLHFNNPADRIEAAARNYLIPLWEGQPCHVEVMVEKQALEGVLEPVCRRLDVPFTANKGYSSSSAMYQCGKRLEEKLDEGKRVKIIYLGDHDPSGLDMSRDVEDRLKLFSTFGDWDESDKTVYDSGRYDEDQFEVIRIALNMDQVRRYAPPPNPTKLTDSRAGGYVRRFGMECWELDALDPETLAGLVRDEVNSHLDLEVWDARREKWQNEKNELLTMAADYRANLETKNAEDENEND